MIRTSPSTRTMISALTTTASLLLMISTSTAATSSRLTTEYLVARDTGYNFTCTVFKHTSSNANAPHKNIVLLHGFPYNREWWHPLLEQWDAMLSSGSEGGEGKLKGSGNTNGTAASDGGLVATSRNGGGGGGGRFLAAGSSSTTAPPTYDVSIHAVACDLRGYSLGASPIRVEDYSIPAFMGDAYSLAHAAGFVNGFHLLGHDLGGVVGWDMAANDLSSGGILSYVSMSMPHVQLFSDAMCGPKQDQDQVVAANYINQMIVEDSAYDSNHGPLDSDGALYKLYQRFFASALGDDDTDQAQFQKRLWWFVAMTEYLSIPPVVSQEEIDAYEGPTFFVDAIREAVPLAPTNGRCDYKKNTFVGAVRIPTLLICGKNDPAILCGRPYAYDYPNNNTDFLPDYEHINYECGHNFFGKGDCDSMEETQAVMDKITSFVLGKQYEEEYIKSAAASGSSRGYSSTVLLVVTTALLWFAL